MKPETQVVVLGREPELNHGIVNPPVYRASTILFPTLADYEAGEHGRYHLPTYGRYGTPTTKGLEHALAELEGADHAIVTSSGLAACVIAIQSFVSQGDHILMTDSVYGPTRKFCDQELKRFGVETTYYDPTIGAGIKALMKPNTKIVYTESPGSLTFEMQDIPAIARIAHEHGALVLSDNTWATPLYFKSFEHGVDISIHSATKYIAGHSDLVMGVIACKKEHHAAILRTYHNLGNCPGADNCYLAQRGLRTMAVRLKQHYAAGMEIARWLAERPEVVEVRHPALPGYKGHDLWKRDMTGACGLFAIKVKPYKKAALAAMLDHLELFGMGFSWGGYESLIIPFNPANTRTATKWQHDGINLRLHIGLENVGDLRSDLEAGFKRLNEAA